MVNNKRIIMLLTFSLAFVLCGCEKMTPKDQIVAKINDHEMTVNDLMEKIEFSPYSANKMPDKKNMLDLAVKEQVLIQEAQKRGLDRKRTFMKTIERYWQQTLIRELLKQENNRIIETVSKDKQAAALNDWIEDLKGNADIEVYGEVLDKIEIKE